MTCAPSSLNWTCSRGRESVSERGRERESARARARAKEREKERLDLVHVPGHGAPRVNDVLVVIIHLKITALVHRAEAEALSVVSAQAENLPTGSNA